MHDSVVPKGRIHLANAFPHDPGRTMAESSNHLSFGAVVREYILPYNTLFAISGVIAFLLSLVSAFLVVAFGVLLVCIALLIIIAHHFGRDALLAWANRDDGTGTVGSAAFACFGPMPMPRSDPRVFSG